MAILACQDIVFDGLQNIWQTGLFSDVEVVIGHQKFLAHKVILSAHSPVLQAMFTCQMKESRMAQIKLNSPYSSALQDVLQFMYKGVIEVNNDNVQDIMYVADQLLIRKVVNLCSDYMVNQLNISNCVDVMHVAEAHSCEGLRQSAFSFICHNFSRVSMEKSFMLLDIKEVMAILNVKDLPFTKEADILHAALCWLTYDFSKRKFYVFGLLSNVRFKALTLAELDDVLSSIDSTDTTYAVITATIRRDLITGKLFRNPKFCKPKRGNDSILLFGGANLERNHLCSGTTSSVYRYEIHQNTWTKLESSKCSRYMHGIGVVGDKVYLIGGQPYPFCLTSAFECYNVTTGVWSQLCPTIDCRVDPMVTIVNGRVYVSSLNELGEQAIPMEVYTPNNDMWSPYASSIGWLPADSTARARREDKLYEVVCADDQSSIRVTPLFLDSDPTSRFDMGVFGEPYYPHPPLGFVYYKCKMVFMHNYLYLIGGSLRSPPQYDQHIKGTPHVHRVNLTKKNKWERVSDMKSPRYGHSAEVLGDKIYVIGGQSWKDEERSTYFMEIYDPELDTWESAAQPCNFIFSASTTY